MQDCPPQWNVNGWTKVFARCSTYLCLDLLLFHDKATGTQQENEQFDQHIGITMYRHRISCPSFCQCSWDCVQFRRVTCSQLALSGVNTVEEERWKRSSLCMLTQSQVCHIWVPGTKTKWHKDVCWLQVIYKEIWIITIQGNSIGQLIARCGRSPPLMVVPGQDYFGSPKQKVG